MMRRAQTILEQGSWDKARAVAVVELTFHDRYRRRITLHDLKGDKFLLDLPKPVVLRDGDGLLLDDGGVIAVRAADEAVADIRAETPAALARLAWHIGNRHTPVQVLQDGRLRIHDDAVLVAMIKGLNGSVTRHKAAFSPEAGAYAPQHEIQAHGHHHHDLHHDHDHVHDHGHDHE
jgi:urease accessory protein